MVIKTDGWVIPFPAARRVRPTPVELRLSVLTMLEHECRRAQCEEQLRGIFTPSLSLAIDWLDLLEAWERAA